jgi:hypothetical protein
MKKNLSVIVFLFIGILAFVSSCVKDTFTEKDAFAQQQNLATLNDSLAKSQALLLDSLKKEGGVINYSVTAVLASDANWLSNLDSKGVQQLDAVKVTISQYGKVQSVTTDATGIASFKDLRVGTVNVNISKTGFTEVDFVAVLPALPDSTVVYAYGLVRNVGTMVPVFSTTTNLSTINGIATFESDLTNDAPEIAAGVEIIADIDVSSSIFTNRYFYYPNPDLELHEYDADGYLTKHWGFDYYGIIKQIAYHSTVSKVTTAADGTFSLKAPSTPDGLPIKIYVSEFAVTQKLLQPTLNNIPVWGVQSIRTIFGPPVTFTYSSIPAIGTAAGQVQSAYVTISAPTGTPAAQPTTEAKAQAVLASSGIVSINIKKPGEGYTQAPLVKIPKGTAFNSVQAEGTAVLTAGKVSSVNITYAGTGYKPSDSTQVAFVEDIAIPAAATAKMGFSIYKISLTGAGTGYTSAPAVTIASNSGTGATATANITGYVSALTLTNGGAGYTATPTVTIAAGTGTVATATAVMTTSNPVLSVTPPTANTYWTPKRRATVITTTGPGSGAITDSTTLSTQGRIRSITLVNAGAGYLAAPAVVITGGGGTGAVAYSSIGAGGILSGITITNKGSGYTSDPTISIAPAPSGGTNATASVTREFQVVAIPVTASGNGYTAATVGARVDTTGTATYVTLTGVGAVLSQSISGFTSLVGGDGYTSAPTVTITPSNTVVPTTAATATSAILNKVKDITVTAQGSGYEKFDATVTIAAPTSGTTATAGYIYRTNGVLKSVTLTNPGVGYTNAPNVYLAIGSGVLPVNQAQITATVSGGQVSGLTIADAGSGYNYASDSAGYYTAVISTYNSSAAATARANPRSGQIDYIQIGDPGAGYSIVPTVEIVNIDSTADANKFGTGAVATATLTDGRVSSIAVTNAGSGYYVAPTIKITIASAVQTAVGQCKVSPDGRIIDVLFPASTYPYTKGYGYNAIPTVTFTPSIPGKGTGATGVAVLKNGQVDNIVMTNQGSGYVGKNNPSSTHNLEITPSFTPIVLFAGKTYVRDFYFGTGKRTIEQ